MTKMLKQMKQMVLAVAKDTGLFSVMADSAWRSRRLLILCYHGISLEDEHQWSPELYMPAHMFEERMQLLKDQEYSVLPLGEAIQRLYSDTLPKRSVSITFDDGMYDFYARVFPALRKFRFPATVYLTTYYCENNLPVFGLACSYMLWKRRELRLRARVFPFVREAVDLKEPQARIDLLDAITRYVDENKLNAREKNELAAKLAEVLNFDFQALCLKRLLHLMTPAEVTELANEGTDFELHTHRHCSPVNKLLFEREIRDNRHRIQKFALTSAVHFCYPSGITHAQFPSWLTESNIVSATTCYPNLASRAVNPLLLPRFVDTSVHSRIEFESWLSGFRCLLPRRSIHARFLN